MWRKTAYEREDGIMNLIAVLVVAAIAVVAIPFIAAIIYGIVNKAKNKR